MVGLRTALLAAALSALGAGCFPTGPLAPVVESVGGNSALPAPPGADGRFHDALVVVGRHLDAAPRAWLARDAERLDLSVRQARATRLELVLPHDLTEGTWTLVVETDGGRAEVDLVLRRGEQGADPPDPHDDYYEWHELQSMLPDRADLLDEPLAHAFFVPWDEWPAPGDFVDESVLDAWIRTEDALAVYAQRADLDDPSGYPSRDEVLSTWATPADLPDTSNAVPLDFLASLDFLSPAEAAALAPTAQQLADEWPTGALADERYVHRDALLTQPVRDAIAAAVDAWVAAAKACPSGMDAVGEACVDHAEAVLRSAGCDAAPPSPPGQAWPSGFGPASASPAAGVFACPAGDGALPTTGVTWWQAVAACAASGKHLCSGAEWFVAAAGTPAACAASGPVALPPGTAGVCVSPSGPVGLVGNAAEWVDVLVPGGGRAGGGVQMEASWPGDAGAVLGWQGAPEGGAGLVAGVLAGGAIAQSALAGVAAWDARFAASEAPALAGLRCCTVRRGP